MLINLRVPPQIEQRIIDKMNWLSMKKGESLDVFSFHFGGKDFFKQIIISTKL
jgi:hypothetical protein